MVTAFLFVLNVLFGVSNPYVFRETDFDTGNVTIVWQAPCINPEDWPGPCEGWVFVDGLTGERLLWSDPF